MLGSVAAGCAGSGLDGNPKGESGFGVTSVEVLAHLTAQAEFG